MKTRFVSLFLIFILPACGGIPLRSLPRLMTLQNDLLAASPAEFMLAIQVDARMVPPPSAVPTLQLMIKPSAPGEFETIDKKLPMHFAVASANELGLATPPAGRQWLLYGLPPASQTELIRLQSDFKGMHSQHHGATIGIGIAQDGVAARDPALANTRWESWLRTSRQEGFYELWSGTIEELLKSAKADDTIKAPKAN